MTYENLDALIRFMLGRPAKNLAETKERQRILMELRRLAEFHSQPS